MRREEFLDRWWGRGLLYGALFGVVMGLVNSSSHPVSVVERLVTGVVAGVVFGLSMGWGTQRQWTARRRRTAAFTAGLTDERRRLAVRASHRGPVPDDPGTRVAAAALARDRLDELTRQRTQALVIFGLVTVMGAVSSR